MRSTLTRTPVGEMNFYVNPLYDSAKLRNITSSYKRHLIRRQIRPENLNPNIADTQTKLRQSAADYFFTYCRQVIPRIEEKLEEQLLEKFKQTLGTEAERREVAQAYYQRKDNIAKMAENKEHSEVEQRAEQLTISGEEISWVVQTVEGDGLSYHTYEDIGRYTVFPENHFKRMFPSKAFGRLEQDEYKINKTWGIMTREEGLRLTNELSKLTLPSERHVNYRDIATFDKNGDVRKEVLQNEENFIAIQQDFSLDLLDYINKQPSDEQRNILKQLFSSAPVFDGLVSMLVQELRKKPIRYHLCHKESRMKVIDQLVGKILKVCEQKKLKILKFTEIVENLPLIELQLYKADLPSELVEYQKNEVHNYKLYTRTYHKICNHFWKPEDFRKVSLKDFKGNNSGLLFWGPRGCGKSQLLTYATAWAHENNWLVMTVPRCEMLTDGRAEIDRFKNGLYLQQGLATQMLSDFRHSNQQLLSELDVDMSLFGKIDISGVKDGDPEPCPRYWDDKRKCWSDSWKENLYDFEIKSLQEKYENMKIRCSDKLTNPKKLIDIADFGIKEPELATSAFGELLEQIYATDKVHTLFAFDGYNVWLNVSNYMSFRYENQRALRGTIPPKDIALVRMLMKFDGHYMRNGFKLLATSHFRQFNHLCTPEMINFPHGYHCKVENLTLNDFRNFLLYCNISEWTANHFKEYEVESWYMETQGNFHAFHESFTKYQRLHY